MNIRILGYKDATKYKELRLQAINDSPTSFCSSYAQEEIYTLQETEHNIRPQTDQFTLGAFEGDQLIGMVTFKRETNANLNHKGRLMEMYVTPEMRKKGIGRAMLEELLRLLKENEGLEQLYVTVEATNVQVLELCKSLDFNQYAIEKRAMKMDGKYFDELWMVKNL
ncbi:GNAT family N-acetyltransferase [Solibacillus sp. A46]|uniref:GNAT family N-acetyltransferase n=1 Tax=Solibacillus faecavium TaxID=2762221 RepID=A0ABR8XXY3_9BACL|nr:GNAT family N-acetyltransferase [Solibacillus faecavium]MBD8036817.1 GNAT family N-acetyltransferase [Solibacillus faecavium]